MTPKQEEHSGELMFFFSQLALAKYRAGAIEHDSNLWEFSDDELLSMALEEVIDLMHYLTTIIQNRKNRSKSTIKVENNSPWLKSPPNQS